MIKSATGVDQKLENPMKKRTCFWCRNPAPVLGPELWKNIALLLPKHAGRVPCGRTWDHFLDPKLVPFSGTEIGAAFSNTCSTFLRTMVCFFANKRCALADIPQPIIQRRIVRDLGAPMLSSWLPPQGANRYACILEGGWHRMRETVVSYAMLLALLAISATRKPPSNANAALARPPLIDFSHCRTTNAPKTNSS